MTSESTTSQKTIAIAGGFDPLHPGHIAMIADASKYGDVHIILESDDSLVRRKGFFFQPWADRKKILEAYTPYIHAVDDEDGTVCSALRQIKPTYFGMSGGRPKQNTHELDLCAELGIEAEFELGGVKHNSSTAINGRRHFKTRWGTNSVILDMPELKVKLLTIDPGKKLSLQRHNKRSEFFFMPNGEVRMNLPGVWHAPQAPVDRELVIVEVQIGVSEENDIERILETEDDFNAEVQKKIDLNY